MLCPDCRLESAHRSHRRGFTDYALSLLGWRPYRCKCGARFRARENAPVESRHAKSIGSEIRATRAAAARGLKRRQFVLWAAAGGLFFAFLFYLTRDRSSGADPR